MNLRLKAKILLGVMMLTPVFNVTKIVPTVCAGDGISSEEQDELNRRLKHAACVACNLKLTEKMLNVGSHFPSDMSIDDRLKALYVTARFGKVDEFKKLMAGHDVNEQGSKGDTALHLAAVSGNADLVKWLLEELNAEPKIRTNTQRTPLHVAARFGKLDVVKVLLDSKKIGMEEKGYMGATPLAEATVAGKIDVVNELLARGADVNARTKDQDVALTLAAYNDRLEIAGALFHNMTCDVNAVNVGGQNALHSTLYGLKIFGPKKNKNSFAMVKLLLDSSRGLRVNACDSRANQTALIYAVGLGRLDLVEELLKDDYAADVNIADKFGDTALHYAVSMGRIDIVSALLKRRDIQVNAVNKLNKTALDLAIGKGFNDVKAALLQHDAKSYAALSGTVSAPGDKCVAKTTN